MKRVVHKSVIPIYAAAALWLLCCLALPMYRLYHYLIYAAAALGVYLGAKRLFPDHVEEVEAPPAPPDSGDPEVDRLILQGRRQLEELGDLGARVRSAELRERVARLRDLGGKIFAALEEDPSRLPRARKFLNYYLPTLLSLLGRYRTLEDQEAQGENISASMERIRDMTGKVETAFQRQLDNLYEAEAMDITAEIQVMQQMMQAEGLLEER